MSIEEKIAHILAAVEGELRIQENKGIYRALYYLKVRGLSTQYYINHSQTFEGLLDLVLKNIERVNLIVDRRFRVE